MGIDERALAEAINRLAGAVEDLPIRLAAALAPPAALPARRGANGPSRKEADRSVIDHLEAFLEDAVQRSPGATLQARKFYEAYAAWAAVRGIEPISEKTFSLTVRTLGPKRDPGRVVLWRDVALKQTVTAPQPH